MKKSTSFAATIAAIEVVTNKSGKQNLQFKLSDMKLDDKEVDKLPSFDEDGKPTTTTAIGKGLRCCVGLAAAGSPFGKVVNAKTGGKPERYEGVTEVLIYLLSGATIKGVREEYEANEPNPDIEGEKYTKATMRTVISGIKLNVDPQLMPFIQTALNNIKEKEVAAALPNPFAV